MQNIYISMLIKLCENMKRGDYVSMLKIIKRSIRISMNKVFSKEINVKLNFRRKHGYKLNLDNPITLSEKIHWIKVYGELTRYANYVDKFEVREYIRKVIGEEYLIPLIGVYEHSRDIDFNHLPNSFIIKATHASGWNLIVKDKTEINWTEVSKTIDKWISSSFYKITLEENYKNIRGRVVVEELIQDKSGDLKDYKFLCYHGEPRFIQVFGDRYGEQRRDIYDTEWNRLPVTFGGYNNFDEKCNRPILLDKMLELARRLSEGFAFVRVDLYCVNEEHIFFGELTFTPANGDSRYNPTDYDRLLGQAIDLGRY
jgi:hypothetical protein